MYKIRPKIDPRKNARNQRERAISCHTCNVSPGAGLKRFSRPLNGSFLKSLYYRAFREMLKKSLKVYLKGVLMGFKRLFYKTGKIPQKWQKSQTYFSGFYGFLAISRLQTGGIS